MTEIRLGPEDLTVFAKCLSCDPHYPGAPVGTFYGKAFTKRRWERDPVCENCDKKLVKLYEVKTD